jgi:hypothetical protein
LLLLLLLLLVVLLQAGLMASTGVCGRPRQWSKQQRAARWCCHTQA